MVFSWSYLIREVKQIVNIKADNGRNRNESSWKSPKCLKSCEHYDWGMVPLDLYVTFTDMDIGLKSHTLIWKLLGAFLSCHTCLAHDRSDAETTAERLEVIMRTKSVALISQNLNASLTWNPLKWEPCEIAHIQEDLTMNTDLVMHVPN